jgi:hypothetical protein
LVITSGGEDICVVKLCQIGSVIDVDS